jgi:hypothetical protein
MAGKTSMPYHDLMRAVFPEDQYPRARRYRTGGGPPGCAMAFNAAIRRMGGSVNDEPHGRRVVYLSSNGPGISRRPAQSVSEEREYDDSER